MDDLRHPPQFVGERLVLARELRGMTQRELAETIVKSGEGGSQSAGLTRGAIAHYENGLAIPSPGVLAQLQANLRVEPGFFGRRISGTDLPASFRSLRSTSAVERRRARQIAQLVHDVVEVLTAAVRLPAWEPLHLQTGNRSPAEVAALARQAWDVPPGPVDNMVLVLERAGCVCAVTPDAALEVDAFSVPFEPNPVVMLSSVKGKRDRSRFDVAHEAGHLLMHRSTHKDVRELEAEAHSFAAAFLMPAEQIREELPSEVDWETLSKLKRQWGVSLAALIKRCVDLGRITDQQYTSAMKYMSMRGWRRHEPVDLGRCEEPLLLRTAVQAAGLSVPGIAAALRLPPADLQSILGDSIDSRPSVVI